MNSTDMGCKASLPSKSFATKLTLMWFQCSMNHYAAGFDIFTEIILVHKAVQNTTEHTTEQICWCLKKLFLILIKFSIIIRKHRREEVP